MPIPELELTTDGWLKFDTLRPAVENYFEAYKEKFEQDLLPRLNHNVRRLTQSTLDLSLDSENYLADIDITQHEIEPELDHFKLILRHAKERLDKPGSIRATKERSARRRYQTYEALTLTLARGISEIDDALDEVLRQLGHARALVGHANQHRGRDIQAGSTMNPPIVHDVALDDKTSQISAEDNDSQTDHASDAVSTASTLANAHIRTQQDFVINLVEQQVALEHYAWLQQANEAVFEDREPTKSPSLVSSPTQVSVPFESSSASSTLVNENDSASTRSSSSLQSRDSVLGRPPSSRTSISSITMRTVQGNSPRAVRQAKANQDAELVRAEAQHEVQLSLETFSLEARVDRLQKLKHELQDVHEARVNEILAIPRRPKIWEIRREETNEWRDEVASTVLKPAKALSDDFGQLLLKADARTLKEFVGWKEKIVDGAQDVFRYANVLLKELENALEEGMPEAEVGISAEEHKLQKVVEERVQVDFVKTSKQNQVNSGEGRFRRDNVSPDMKDADSEDEMCAPASKSTSFRSQESTRHSVLPLLRQERKAARSSNVVANNSGAERIGDEKGKAKAPVKQRDSPLMYIEDLEDDDGDEEPVFEGFSGLFPDCDAEEARPVHSVMTNNASRASRVDVRRQPVMQAQIPTQVPRRR